jgi:hypothetical protein
MPSAGKVSLKDSSTMETNMNLRALMFLGFAGFIAQPAFAQTTPTSVQATIDSLLASGYEVKAVNVMSDAAMKEIFPGQTLTSQVFITLREPPSQSAKIPHRVG